mmetsp:Transcript_43284/g.109309  ORF Transcript_43284/g.109309 Transcript_43284/m.109309 type:complete len:202 (+) Transcript_43284:2256-2861(+)
MHNLPLECRHHPFEPVCAREGAGPLDRLHDALKIDGGAALQTHAGWQRALHQQPQVRVNRRALFLVCVGRLLLPSNDDVGCRPKGCQPRLCAQKQPVHILKREEVQQRKRLRPHTFIQAGESVLGSARHFRHNLRRLLQEAGGLADQVDRLGHQELNSPFVSLECSEHPLLWVSAVHLHAVRAGGSERLPHFERGPAHRIV